MAIYSDFPQLCKRLPEGKPWQRKIENDWILWDTYEIHDRQKLEMFSINKNPEPMDN